MQTAAIITLTLCALFGRGLAQSTPSNPPQDYTFTYRRPSDCTPAGGDCDYFVGIQENEGDSDFLDFYLEGADEGWVAIGFSTTANMFDADVLGCIRTTTDIGAVDTWNPDTPRTNILTDDTQDVIENFVEYNNGRIICDFTRSVSGTDDTRDLNLLAQNYWLLYGTGLDQRTGALPLPFNYHGINNTPEISTTRVNITMPSGSGAQAVQAHGLLMIITVSVIAVTAVFFAA